MGRKTFCDSSAFRNPEINLEPLVVREKKKSFPDFEISKRMDTALQLAGFLAVWICLLRFVHLAV